jgi:hypothetical protein
VLCPVLGNTRASAAAWLLFTRSVPDLSGKSPIQAHVLDEKMARAAGIRDEALS